MTGTTGTSGSTGTTSTAGTGQLPSDEIQLRALASQLDDRHLSWHAPLAPYTTFQIGGPADLLYNATDAESLATAVQLARSYGVPWFVLGLGANILVGDRGVRGLVIRNSARGYELSDTGLLSAESGAVMRELILSTTALGWSGLEHYIGIPSTVGGALWQNLHFLSPAPARERTMFIAEVFRDCEILAEDGARRTVDASYVKFGYDDSVFHHKRDVILSASFQLERGDPDTLQRIMQENLSWRGARHPWLEIHPSAGSIFKKIENVGAGRLIDECGLKGFRVGGAAISQLHANIMVNVGGATAADVRALIAHVQQAVESRFGHHLEPEIGFIGEF